MQSNPCQPRVSVIIPSFNRRDLLVETLDSLSAQSLREWEVIVVDDGSTDGTQDMLESYIDKEPRVRFFPRKRPNKGGNPCRNDGLNAAEGDYIIFLDSDDLMSPECLKARVEAMDANPDLDYAIFPARMFYETPGDCDDYRGIRTERDEIDRLLQMDVICQTTGPIWRTRAFGVMGELDESILIWKDWDMMMCALIHELKFEWFREPCYYWRIHGENKHVETSSKNADTQKSEEAKSYVKEYESLKPLEHLKSHMRLFDKVYRMLGKHDKLTEDRKHYLGGLTYWLANRWMMYGEPEISVSLWQKARERGYITAGQEREGLMYFRSTESRIKRAALRKYIHATWPAYLFPDWNNPGRRTL